MPQADFAPSADPVRFTPSLACIACERKPPALLDVSSGAEGIVQLAADARDAGEIVAETRQAIEARAGKPVVTRVMRGNYRAWWAVRAHGKPASIGCLTLSLAGPGCDPIYARVKLGEVFGPRPSLSSRVPVASCRARPTARFEPAENSGGTEPARKMRRGLKRIHFMW